MADTLTDAIADALGEVPLIARHGGTLPVAEYERIVRRIAERAEPFITWLPEKDAALHSGKAVAWLRDRFPRWDRDGHARVGPTGGRQYLEIVLPRRADLDAVRADAARAARGQVA